MSNQGRGIVVKWELVHKSKTIYPVTNGRPGEKEDLLSVVDGDYKYQIATYLKEVKEVPFEINITDKKDPYEYVMKLVKSGDVSDWTIRARRRDNSIALEWLCSDCEVIEDENDGGERESPKVLKSKFKLLPKRSEPIT
ncbi:MAG: hypothetical protein PF637_06050 [Spirochaetes bacterium]|jgi:hypothetical protein|nr:hypothetical protein [Spirochaetota bacterium]